MPDESPSRIECASRERSTQGLRPVARAAAPKGGASGARPERSERALSNSPEPGRPGRSEGAGSEPRAGTHPLLRTLAASIRAHRQALGWTRQVLATRSGLSLRFLAEVESGQANLSVLKLADLAQALRVPLASLLAGAPSWTEERTPAPVVALVGLRGAGKSTIGPLLAQRLDVPFIELDTLVQEASGLATAELFELHGEGAYRRAEREALERVVQDGKPCVVAASGGVVTDARCLGLLRERTLMVWLRARPDQYIPRLEAQGDRRPMANRPNALAQLHGLLRARAPLYGQARITFDTSEAGPSACAEQLAAQIRRLAAPPA